MNNISSKVEPLRIGLLVDNKLSSKYVFDICEWSNSQDDISISHLIIVENNRKYNNNNYKGIINFGLHGVLKIIETISFKLVVKLEGYLLSRSLLHKDHLKNCDLSTHVTDSVKISPIIQKSGAVHQFSDQDIEKIKSLKLDLIIICGDGSFHDQILSASRLGIISLHYGDDKINRGSPAGFWEVYRQKRRTGFTIQKLTGELGGGEVLYRGHVSTANYYLLNQAKLFLTSNYYLKLLLKRIAENKALPAAADSVPYSQILYGKPNVFQVCFYFSQLVFNRMREKAKELGGRRARWGVAFLRSSWNTAVLCRGAEIPNPPNHLLADPFVITKNGGDYCFVEDLDYATDRGSIAVYELQTEAARRVGTAIEEPFHMSFPFLLEYDGNLYMCPETCEAKEIRLYKCIQFPLEWKLEKILMNNVDAADTMIFKKDGLWWMMTNIDPVGAGDYNFQLSIYYADNPLTDEWTPHPLNPVFVDPDKGRNGGLLTFGDEFYRVAQKQGRNVYGESCAIYKILHIGKHNYEEMLIVEISPTFFKGIFATHHMHSNNRVTVYDFCRMAKTKN